MKIPSILLIFGITIFAYSSAMADCSVELPYKELVDCITSNETEPDVTDLMSNEAEGLSKPENSQAEKESIKTISALTKEPPR